MKKGRVSKHGRRRMLERSGITKGVSGKIAYRALHHGIRKESTTGELLAWLNERNLHGGRELRLYGGMLYVFSKDTVVTSISIPEPFASRLEDYIVPDAYKEYITFKKSLRNKRHDEESGKEKNLGYHSFERASGHVLRDPATIKAVLNRFLNDEALHAEVEKVKKSYVYPYDYECSVSCKSRYESGKICRELRRIGSRHHLRLRIVANVPSDS